MSVKHWKLPDVTTTRAVEEVRQQSNKLASDRFFKDVKFLTNDDGTKDLTFTAGATRTFKHKLGREYNGYIVVSRSAPYSPYTNMAADDDASQIIKLITGNNVVLRILIF